MLGMALGALTNVQYLYNPRGLVCRTRLLENRGFSGISCPDSAAVLKEEEPALAATPQWGFAVGPLSCGLF